MPAQAPGHEVYINQEVPCRVTGLMVRDVTVRLLAARFLYCWAKLQPGTRVKTQHQQVPDPT
jgi:hypothetical protein